MKEKHFKGVSVGYCREKRPITLYVTRQIIVLLLIRQYLGINTFVQSS